MSGKHVAEEGKEANLQDALRVVRGAPTADELATVIAVLAAAHAEEEAAAEQGAVAAFERFTELLKHAYATAPKAELA